jgi:hypothetical protein
MPPLKGTQHMNIHIVKNDQKLNELARTLFKIEGPDAPALEKKAVAELKRTNPQLSATKPLPAGVPLMVPEVEGLKRADEKGDSAGLYEELLKQLARALKGADKTLNESITRLKERDQQMLKDLTANQRVLKNAHPEAFEKMATTAKTIKARAKEFDQEAKLNDADLKQLAADLKQMTKL